jgi:RHS repeat-associated protein
VKKITRKSSGDKYVTVYIDGIFEHSYHLDGSNAMDEELNELHVMDDQTRVAMLRIGYDDGTPFTKYILSDHLGSSNVILETSGAVYNREEYYPFGELRSNRERLKKSKHFVSQTSFGAFGKKRYRYVGKEKDEESGLYYYGARYFQPWSCRFISVDPLAADYPFYTPYQYAGNKPITKVDRDGLEETGASPQQNNVEQPQKSIEQLVTIDPKLIPVKPNVPTVDQLNANRDDEIAKGTWTEEKQSQFTKSIEESKAAWEKYKSDSEKYQFLKNRIEELASADENSRTALGMAKSDILSSQKPILLTIGKNLEDDLGKPVNAYTTPSVFYTRMPDELGGKELGFGALAGFTITFDYEKIMSDRLNSDAANQYQKELRSNYSSTKVESTSTSTFVHELGHIRFVLLRFGAIISRSLLEHSLKENEKYAVDFEKYYFKEIYPR